MLFSKCGEDIEGGSEMHVFLTEKMGKVQSGIRRLDEWFTRSYDLAFGSLVPQKLWQKRFAGIILLLTIFFPGVLGYEDVGDAYYLMYELVFKYIPWF